MSVDQGQADLRSLETIQKAQYSMRPIFAEYFSSGYKLRSQMVGIRRCLAENGLDYNKLMDLDKQVQCCFTFIMPFGEKALFLPFLPL